MGKNLVHCASVIFVITFGPAFSQERKQAPPRSEVNITLLNSKAVLEQLEIAPFQQEELDEKVSKQKARVAEVAAMLRAAKPEERPAIMEQLRAEQTLTEQDVYDILLPHQRLRLMQLSRQSLTKPTDVTAGLLHKRTVEALGLTESQLADVKAKASEVEGRLKERIEALKKEIEREQGQARTEVLSVLTEEQRKRYQEFYGPIIDFQAHE